MKPLYLATWFALLLLPLSATGEETTAEPAKKTVPALLQQLVHKDYAERRQAAEELGKLGAAARGASKELARALQDESPEVRVAAAWALWRIEGKPEPVVPVLIAVLKLPEKEVEAREAACKALGEIGPAAKDAVPLLFQETFKQFKGGIINYAVLASDDALKTIVPSRVPLFLDAFTWESLPANQPSEPALPESQPEAAQAARERVPQVVSQRLALLGAEIVPELLPALKDKSPLVRRGVASTLARLGEVTVGDRSVMAKKCRPALQLALQDVDALVRVHAAFALFRVTLEATEAVPVLAAALADKNPIVRWRAAESLEKIGPPAQGAIPSLVTALADPENFAAATALGAIGETALPATITALKDQNPRVREAATVAVSLSPCDRSTAVPALQTALQDDVREVRSGAARAVGNIGPTAAAARTELVSAMRENQIELSEAATALGRLGPKARDAAPALLQAMERDDATKSLADIAAALGQLDREAAMACAQFLADGLAREEGRRERVLALGQLKGLAAPAVPQLAKLLVLELPKEQQYLPISVMRVLRELGPAAKEAVPALSELLTSDRGEYVRAEAARTLGNLGPAAASAKPALVAAARDEKNPRLQRAAQQALQKIAP